MICRLIALTVLLSAPAVAAAQQPVPLAPGGGPPSIAPEPLPPIAPRPQSAPVPGGGAGAAGAQRVFCDQPISFRLPDPEATPERYRRFVGVWSDASWTPQLCAALIVESVKPDGTATIVYAFGPMSPDAKGQGGVLRGTGIVRNGELRFQNSDGSQFAFRTLYADLDGRLTTPQGQSYQAVFKSTP